MNYNEFKKTFSLNTMVGRFTLDYIFTLNDPKHNITEIDRWPDAPLDWGWPIFPFIIYNEIEKHFEVWYFCYEKPIAYYEKNENDYGFVMEDDHELVNYNTTEDYFIQMSSNDYEDQLNTIIDLYTRYYAIHFNHRYEHILLTYDDVKIMAAKLNDSRNN